MIILGIETSCDETALALIETRENNGVSECKVIASIIHSQAELHSAYGGVFPNLAKREHEKNLIPLFHKLLIEAKEFLPKSSKTADIKSFDKAFRERYEPQNPELVGAFLGANFLNDIPAIDMIAVTEGPGLEPALWVGIVFAEMLSQVWSMPLHAVDHMEGHIVGSLLPSDIANSVWHKLHEVSYPALALLISGGHTEFVSIDNPGSYKVVGATLDDAVGEAFDKSARLLGLSYPGGPHISFLAQKAKDEGVKAPVSLPRPMIHSKDLNFSFSGLKTAVLYATRTAPRDKDGNIDEIWKKGLALELEEAIVETLDRKLRDALEQTGAKTLILGGGVSANRMIREKLSQTSKELGVNILLPSPTITGDNAIMIALACALGGKNADKQKARSLRASGTKRLA